MKSLFFVKYLLLVAFLAASAFASEYDKSSQKLTIEDYYSLEGTDEGAKQIIKENKNKDIQYLDYTLVVVMEARNSVSKVDPVKDRDFPKELLELKTIENISDLTLTYQKTKRDHSWHETYYQGSIKKDYISKFKSVKHLTLNYIKLSQDNIKEIAALSKLVTLTLNECVLDNLNFKPFKDHGSLEYLNIISRSGNYEFGGDLGKNILKYFNTVNYLEIKGYEMSQDNINEICSLNQLEFLTYPINKKVNTDCMKDMSITHLDLTYYDHSMDGDSYDEDLVKRVEKLNLPNSLTSLAYHGIDFSEDNYKEIVSVSNLSKLYEIDFMDERQYQDLDNLRKKYLGDDYDYDLDDDDELLSKYVEYDKDTKSLDIEDRYQKEGTKYGAKNIINEYKDKDVKNLNYHLVVVLEVHNSESKVDPVSDRDFPEDIFKFKKLQSLILSYEKAEQDHSWHKTYHKGSIKKGYLKNFKTVTHLTLKNIKLSQDNINDIASLSKLTTLTLDDCEFDSLSFKPFEKNTSLKNLELLHEYGSFNYGDDINKNVLKYFKNIEILKIEGYEMTQTNVNEICSLKKLNHLAYPINKKIDTKCQKDLPLAYLEVSYYEHAMDGDEYDEDLEIKVKKLNLPKDLEKFYYKELDLTEDNYKELVALKHLNELCEIKGDDIDVKDLKALRKKYSSSNTSTSVVSTNGKCGPKNGNTVCPAGKCCSKYGWCGTSDDHCKAGCQSEFGKCTSTDNRCGPKFGNKVCSNGKCCSKYGWCGTTDDHCMAGCQSEFGKCTSLKDRCGPNFGNTSCPSGKCCSKYGWCGTTDDHCKSGCQSEFGKCK